MSDISERHEIRVRGPDHTIVFTADSEDGRVTMRPSIREELRRRIARGIAV